MKRYCVTLSVLHAYGTPHEHWRQFKRRFGKPALAAKHAAELVYVVMQGRDIQGFEEQESWYLLTNGRERASCENASRTMRVEVEVEYVAG